MHIMTVATHATPGGSAAGTRLEQGERSARCSSGLPRGETCRDYGGNERLTLDASHVI
jgi:hypothetical protein